MALRGRSSIAVIGDMVDGIIVAGGLTGIDGGLVRDQLWSAVAVLLDDESDSGGEPLLARRAA